MTKRPFVEIVEVGPRDGLQNEARAIPIAEKIALIDSLSSVGFRRIEAASFVSPKWVPQMAGSARVMAGISRAKGVRYIGLVPNMRGLEDALAAKVDEVAIFASASEGFSRANINATIEESLVRFRPVLERARAVGVVARGYISCVTDCPYDGPVKPQSVLRVAQALDELGADCISLGDTIGQAAPESIDRLLAVMTDHFAADRLVGHYHDTTGRALDNVSASLARGLRTFDASVAGLGGCPFAPGAAGNVSTNALARFLETAGFAHGLDFDALSRASNIAIQITGKAA